MTARPVLFSAPMILALLAGRKTQTRRLAWRDACFCGDDPVPAGHKPETTKIGSTPIPMHRPPSAWQKVKLGDLLWVKETFVLENTYEYHSHHDAPTDGRPILARNDGEGSNYALIPHYRATEPEPHIVPDGLEDEFDDRTRWVSSLFMPRTVSRLTCEVTAVRRELLQSITKEDVIAEGITEREGLPIADAVCGWHEPYAALWDGLHDRAGERWDNNPEVVVISFRCFKVNVDALLKQREAA